MGDPGETIPVRKRGQNTKNKTGSQAAKQRKQRNKFRMNKQDETNNSLSLHNKENAHTPSQQVAMGSTTRNNLNKKQEIYK